MAEGLGVTEVDIWRRETFAQPNGPLIQEKWQKTNNNKGFFVHSEPNSSPNFGLAQVNFLT